MKYIFSWFFLTFSIVLHSQEINAGLNVGLVPLDNNSTLSFSLGSNVEYRPTHAFFSFNTDPFVLFYNSKAIITVPIYLKFIVGKKLRFCPSAGGFVRSSGSYGWNLGLHLEYVLKNKFILFSKNECYNDYFEDYWPDHFGGGTTYINHSISFQYSLGVKMMLKK